MLMARQASGLLRQAFLSEFLHASLEETSRCHSSLSSPPFWANSVPMTTTDSAALRRVCSWSSVSVEWVTSTTTACMSVGSCAMIPTCWLHHLLHRGLRGPPRPLSTFRRHPRACRPASLMYGNNIISGRSIPFQARPSACEFTTPWEADSLGMMWLCAYRRRSLVRLGIRIPLAIGDTGASAAKMAPRMWKSLPHSACALDLVRRQRPVPGGLPRASSCLPLLSGLRSLHGMPLGISATFQ